MQTPAAVTTLDLQLQETGDGQSLAAQLLTPSALVRLPPIPLDIEGRPGDLLQRAQRWQRAFRTTHIAKVAGTEPRRVQEASAELLAALQRLLAHPTWGALPQALERHPQLPLRIEIPTAASASRPPGHPLQLAEQLPWEDLPLNRPIWRICSAEPSSQRTPSPPQWRRPRLLVVVGPAKGLDVNAQMEPLRRLARGGRLELRELTGPESTADNLRRCLADPRGWDGLVYLGHGEPRGGQVGLLALGDGSALAGDNLSAAMAQATARGLSWVLLSSCHSSELVPLCLQAGVPWMLAFRDEVPDPIALAAFLPVLADLERGHSLPQAAASARAALERQFPGSSQLLCLVARRDAQALRLPLRRRHLWRRRLAQSQRSQLRAAGVVLGLALGVYGLGWGHPSPVPSALLDLRLEAQRIWRDWRGRSQPPGSLFSRSGPPLVVWMLDTTFANVPNGASGQGDRISRKLLAQILEVLRADQIPSVGFDVVLDDQESGQAVQPEATADLASVIDRQRRNQLFNIYYPDAVYAANSRGAGAQQRSNTGKSSLPSSVLIQNGLISCDGGMGVDPAFPPLQLSEALRSGSFAAALAMASTSSAVPCIANGAPVHFLESEPPSRPVALPAGSVIDWTIDWFNPALLRVVMISSLQPDANVNNTRSLSVAEAARQLPSGSRVLIGKDSKNARSGSEDAKDLFFVPVALESQPSWRQWGNPLGLPGPLVQAVLAESLARRHWLSPLGLLPCVALTAGLGVLLAAVLERRRSRLLALLLISLLAVPASFELALGARVLVPLLFPLGALWATCLSRQEPRR
jgi:hypothetical protein